MLIKIDIACGGGENTSTYLNKKKFLSFPDWLSFPEFHIDIWLSVCLSVLSLGGQTELHYL